MENNDEANKNLDQALSAGDDWLRKQGVITDFSVNTILAWVYLNFQKVENVEMDVDRPKQQLYIRIYLGFWTLFLMTIFRRKDEFLDEVFNWLSEYLPTYELSVELKRYKGKTGNKFTVNKDPEPEEEAPEAEGNIAQALKERKNVSSQPDKDPTSVSLEADKTSEPA